MSFTFSDSDDELTGEGNIKMTIINKLEVPLEETKLKVMVELTGAGSVKDRAGLDLVTVLDVSGSMRGERLDKMKTAMRFLIKKLTPIDCLSVVTFSGGSKRLCTLRQITENSKAEIEDLVNGIKPRGDTNITQGLETGLKVVSDRSLTSGRVVAIMLMSDGEQNRGTDATEVRIDNVPVHTFGFGQDYDPKVLKAIADNSMGGTFSDVQNQNNLTIAFSQCLAGLLTVVAQDLTLTVKERNSEIQKVYAGSYLQDKDFDDGSDGSVTVLFGDLYDKETRKVIVDLLLPAVSKRARRRVIEVTYSTRTVKANRTLVIVIRTGSSMEPESEEVVNEESRLRIAQIMKQVRIMADNANLRDAQNKLVEAQTLLENDVSNPMIEMLKSELRRVFNMTKTREIYQRQGRCFALSSETSHDCQRFATRGDMEELRLYATPLMDAYLEQAKSFDKEEKPLVLEAGSVETRNSFAGKMSFTFNDDELTEEGNIKMTIIKKLKVPLEETNLKVMLELTGAGSVKDRAGVHLVTVLDVSGSMYREKLDKMKTAMRFLVKKLTPIDCLSVVTFSGRSTRLCTLRQITENSKAEIEDLVNGIKPSGSTNITDGLETGLKVLSDCSLTNGRVVGIMLMSDSQQNRGGDASQVRIDNVPVHTFGFGEDYNPELLKAIADNSMGGTFSDVQNEDNLTIAFAQCLAGLLTVVAQDLTLTVSQQESKIQKVYAGSYLQDDDDGSVTVSFGDLYYKETRKVIVDLLLPAVSKRAGMDVIQVTYSTRTVKANTTIVTITRTKLSMEPEREKVVNEESRLRIAQMMKQVRIMADNANLQDAQNKLVEAQTLLENDVSNPMNEMLKSELRHVFNMTKSREIYQRQGRCFALSSETSHDRQRFATRGDIEELRLYATPHMDAYLEQAKSFDKEPWKPLPTTDEDVKQEHAVDPTVGALSYYILSTIQSFKSIDSILDSIRH